jgi:mannose-6-phosphate isomerase-like protein (cupin superfamily)
MSHQQRWEQPARYHVFLLSLWQANGAPGQPADWRYSLEGAQISGRKGFADLADLAAYLDAWIGSQPKTGPLDAAADALTIPPTHKELPMPMSINRTGSFAVIHPPGDGETASALGVNITYKTVGSQSDGRWLALEYTAPPRFAGPPPHWHKVTTEIFYVLEGALSLRVGDESIQAGPGGYAFVPPRTVHAFSNETDAPAKYLLVASPAGLENYFAELAELVKGEPSWPPKDMSKLVALMAKYDTFPPQANA